MHIITFIESWIAPGYEVHIEGFKTVSKARGRIARTGRYPGGILALIRDEIKEKIEIIETDLKEIIWLKTKMKQKDDINICFGFVYNPPEGSVFANKEFFTELAIEINRIKNTHEGIRFVLMGDFNARIADRKPVYCKDAEEILINKRTSQDKGFNNYGEKLLELCGSEELYILNGWWPNDERGNLTFITDTGGSAIDLTLSSKEALSLIKWIDVKGWGESHHLPIIIKMINKEENRVAFYHRNIRERTVPKFIWREDLIPEFKEYFEGRSFEIIKTGIRLAIETNQTDKAIKLIENSVSIAGHRMQAQGKITNKKSGWYNEECRRKKSELMIALELFRTLGGQELRMAFCSKRKEYKELLVRTKDLWQRKQTDNLNKDAEDKNTKKVWYRINQICRDRKKPKQVNISHGEWIDHFKKLLSGEDCWKLDVQKTGVSRGLEFTLPDLDKNISGDEVKELLEKGRKGKAGAISGINNEFWKEVGKNSFILDSIVKIFNKIFDGAKFPKSWQEGIICPIYKKRGDKSNPSNYRGITLLDSLSKIYTGILSNRLMNWAEGCSILSRLQSGFRKGMRTSDNLMIVKTLMDKYIKKKRGKMYITSIDLEKAFDSVSRRAVVCKLGQIGVSGKMIRAIENIYLEFKCSIKVKNGVVVGEINSKLGLKQGCKLSPILFLLFINDIFESKAFETGALPCLENQDIPGLIFADDILLLSLTPVKMQNSINEIEKYCKEWNLKVNPQKTRVIVCKRGDKLSKSEQWWMGKSKLEVVKKTEYLGTIISSNGSWSEQIKRAKMKGVSALASIKILDKKMPNIEYKVMKNVFNAVVKAKVLYGVEIWGVDQGIVALDVVVSKFAKIIMGLPSCTANSGVRMMCEGVSIRADIVKRIVKYWLRLKTGRGGEILGMAYQHQMKHQNEGYWVDGVKKLLDDIGRGCYWETNSRRDDRGLCKKVVQRVIDIERQAIRVDCNSKRTLIEFCKLSENMTIRTQMLTKREMRGIIWLLMGVYKNKALREKNNENKCILCNTSMEVAHLIKDCKETRDIREKYIDKKEIAKIENESELYTLAKLLNREWRKPGRTAKLCNIIRGIWEKKRKEGDNGENYM